MPPTSGTSEKPPPASPPAIVPAGFPTPSPPGCGEKNPTPRQSAETPSATSGRAVNADQAAWRTTSKSGHRPFNFEARVPGKFAFFLHPMLSCTMTDESLIQSSRHPYNNKETPMKKAKVLIG